MRHHRLLMSADPGRAPLSTCCDPPCSYERMGTANVTCLSGCSCNSTLLDGTWERRASLFTITRFEVGPPLGEGSWAWLGSLSWLAAMPSPALAVIRCGLLHLSSPAATNKYFHVLLPRQTPDRLTSLRMCRYRTTKSVASG